MVTLEAALSLSGLVAVFVLMIGGIATGASYIAAIDAAGIAARAHAIGEPLPASLGDKDIRINDDGAWIHATATIGRMHYTAHYPKED
ncbi:hypothetical protein [Corynebacterium argentoratense]|uniref:hypothetical protein n=1 Tax=Corynebacterium argentoratense TaxID=42817 RepID=UPI001F45D876|nr:hypothetical protein [Corynebacterium argentoratense]MCF1765452.1 hypothetical protein [Corynebacterium argentoratense]